jgi:hypothetical protein
MPRFVSLAVRVCAHLYVQRWDIDTPLCVRVCVFGGGVNRLDPFRPMFV